MNISGMQADTSIYSERAKTWLSGCFLSHLRKSDLLNLDERWIRNGSKGNYITAINVTNHGGHAE